MTCHVTYNTVIISSDLISSHPSDLMSYDIGATGATGMTGSTGVKGDTGPAGATGR
jgi:hypothetical protein